MSTTLITVQKDTLIDTAAILLLEHKISCLPVVAKDEAIEGILTWKDMLKFYVYLRYKHQAWFGLCPAPAHNRAGFGSQA